MSISLELPWPNTDLNPNRRTHWAKLARLKKKARADAHTAGLGARLNRQMWGEGRIPLAISFYPPDKRRRDLDNLIASMKAAQDGLADAMGVDDSQFQTTYRLRPKKENENSGFVRVVIG